MSEPDSTQGVAPTAFDEGSTAATTTEATVGHADGKPSRKTRLNTRDLINVGVFAALYQVVIFFTGAIGFAAPWLIFVGWTAGIVLNGIVITLFIYRTPKIGALTLLGVLTALIYVTFGHWLGVLLLIPLLSFIADLIVAGDRKRPQVRVPLAYAVFALTMVVTLLPIILAPDSYYDELTAQMGPDYVAAMRSLFLPWVMGIWAVCVFVLGLIGGVVGVRVGRKHFQRAGLA